MSVLRNAVYIGGLLPWLYLAYIVFWKVNTDFTSDEYYGEKTMYYADAVILNERLVIRVEVANSADLSAAIRTAQEHL